MTGIYLRMLSITEKILMTEPNFTKEDERNCKMIAILTMVMFMIERVADDKADHVDGETAAGHLAKDCEDLCMRSMELFRNRTLRKEIERFSKYLGLQIEIERIEKSSVQ